MLTTNLRFLLVGFILLIVGCQKDSQIPKESQSPFKVFRKPVNWNIHGIFIDQQNPDDFLFWGGANVNDNFLALLGTKSEFALEDFFLDIDANVVLHDIKISQSKIAFAGEINFKTGTSITADAVIGVCNKNGELIWWDTLQGQYEDEFNSICFLNDSLIAAVGTTQTSPKASKSIISCFGLDGNRKWSKLIDGFSLVEKGIQINQLSESEVLLTKSVSSGSGGRYEYLALNSFLIENGLEGSVDIEFVKQSSFKGWGTSFFRGIDVWNAKTVVNKNSDILVFGQRLQDQSFGDPKAYLFGVCISETGALKWEKEYDFLYDQAYLNDVQIEDSCILSVSYLKDGQINNDLLILNELGSPTKQIRLDLSSSNYTGIPWEIHSNDGGYQIIGDLVDLRSGSKDIFSLQINKKGEVTQ